MSPLPWQDENTPLKSIKEIEEEREAEKKRQQRFVSSGRQWESSVKHIVIEVTFQSLISREPNHDYRGLIL